MRSTGTKEAIIAINQSLDMLLEQIAKTPKELADEAVASQGIAAINMSKNGFEKAIRAVLEEAAPLDHGAINDEIARWTNQSPDEREMANTKYTPDLSKSLYYGLLSKEIIKRVEADLDQKLFATKREQTLGERTTTIVSSNRVHEMTGNNGRKFNVVQLMQGTVIDGRDVSGATFAPNKVVFDEPRPGLATVTLRKTKPIRLYLRGTKDTLDVDSEKLVASMQEEYASWKKAQEKSPEQAAPNIETNRGEVVEDAEADLQKEIEEAVEDAADADPLEESREI